jgi:hypothetical protein
MIRARQAFLAGAAAAAVLLAVACGEGRVIFNVDVHSFITASGDDTVRYLFPSIGAVDTSSDAQEITLVEGLGSSVIEEVSATGAVQFRNDSGTVTLGFQLFVAADSAGTYAPANLAVDIPPTTLTGLQTITVPISANFNQTLEALFTQPTLWFRVVVAGNNSGGTTAGGKMIVTSLNLRVVMQEDLF